MILHKQILTHFTLHTSTTTIVGLPNAFNEQAWRPAFSTAKNGEVSSWDKTFKFQYEDATEAMLSPDCQMWDPA